MSERALTGFSASPGLAAGPAVLLGVAAAAERKLAAGDRPAELERAREALRLAAADVQQIASRLRAEGRTSEAEIIETGVLIACDPTLDLEVARLVLDAGSAAAVALREATDAAAARLADLPDPVLAERADDVRSLGRRAAAHLLGQGGTQGGGVLVADGLGPADVAELGPDVRGIALAGGGVTAHAAIVARSLGLPMVVGLGPELLQVSMGETVIVDGDRGRLVRFPGPSRVAAAESDTEGRARARARAIAGRDRPAATRDGRRIRVLVNAASAGEVREGLAQGAEGVGLLRTELSFLDARAWPAAAQHVRFLEPLLSQLGGRVATVRLLDFGGDKTPPFLAGAKERGIELMLGAPAALRAQLEAIVEAGAGTQLRILVPMITTLEQVRAVRRVLNAVVGDGRVPALGAMIETPQAARQAHELVPALDFISLGTNDLTQLALGLDRERSGASPVTHPTVLRLIDAASSAGNSAEIPVEVCGEAASDPLVIPLLVGLGANELSVGAARVGEVRELVRGLDAGACRELAERSLLDQAAHAGREGV